MIETDVAHRRPLDISSSLKSLVCLQPPNLSGIFGVASRARCDKINTMVPLTDGPPTLIFVGSMLNLLTSSGDAMYFNAAN